MSVDIKSGDLVVLKSGGPTMSARLSPEEGFWECFWFDGVNLRFETLPIEVLVRAESEAGKAATQLPVSRNAR